MLLKNKINKNTKDEGRPSAYKKEEKKDADKTITERRA